VAESKENGRPPLEDEIQNSYSVGMTPSLMQAIKDYAKTQHTSVSAVIRDAVRDKLHLSSQRPNGKDAD
jgi:hypothetical protein